MRVRSRGFGLLEVILVFAVILGAAGLTFSVFHSAQVAQQADSESTFLRTAIATVPTIYPTHNYAGVSTWWGRALSTQAPIARSPNGYNWSLKAYKNNGDCTDAQCPAFWMTYYYRDGDMPEEVCQRLVMDLSRSYFINAAVTTGQPVPLSASSAAQLCDRNASGGAPLFLSIVAN